MRNFGRAIRLALRRRWTVAGVFLTSLVVALFWGANIGTIYPLVEVVFRGQSLPAHISAQLEKTQRHAAELAAECDELSAKLDALPEEERAGAARDLAALQFRADTEAKALATLQWAAPWVNRILPDDPYRTLLVVVAALLVGTVIKDLFLVANMMLVERLVQLTTLEIRSQFFRRTLRMDLAAFGEDRTGQLLSRFTSDLGALSMGVGDVFGRALREPLKALACLIGAALICPRLLLLSLVISPLAAVLVAKLARSLKRANRRALEETSQIYNLLSEAFSGIAVVKAFNMERYERRKFHVSAKKFYRRAMRIRLYDALIKPATEVMGISIVGLAILAGGYLVLNQETHFLGIRMSDRPLSLGSLMAFYALLIGVSDPARKLTEVMNYLQRGAAGADRVYELLDREPSVSDPAKPRSVPSPFRELVFEEVSFHYTASRPVLRELSLRVEAGETLAIVGANGCGKSTLVNMIPRFYDPVRGKVRLDHVDLREMRIRDLRAHVGLVTQQTLLFDDTILNNIRYGSPHASEQEVIAAAKKAHAHRFIIENLEHGYQTIVGEQGRKLSGGQRQRIALARAILRNPAILILDEATSQVDLADEQLIHEVLREFIKDRTAVMITHRLSTLSLADRILVMEQGKIVDVGTHSELLSRCELYGRLHDIHFRQVG